MEIILNLYNELYYHFTQNTIEGGGLFVIFFILGNFFMVLISSIFCLIFKRISLILYDVFGFILGSSILSMILNLVVLIFPFVFFNLKAKPMFYLGSIVTFICYTTIAYNFFWLNNLGKKMLEQKNNP